MRDRLADAYMSRIEFHLEFLSGIVLKPVMILNLRRELAGSARVLEDDDLSGFLDPQLPDDPIARKLFQKPAPPFVIEAPESDELKLEPGDQFSLKVCFFGNLGENVSRFARLLQSVGEKGLFMGEGRFEIDMIVGRDQAGNQQMLWRNGPLPQIFSAPMVNLRWLVDEHCSDEVDGFSIQFRTPARLLTNNKPIFQPSFAGIFPFILRRVTSMIYFWSGIELLNDSSEILVAVNDLRADCNGLAWQDWRQLQGDDKRVDLGGLAGELIIDDRLPDTIRTVLTLGEIFHIGKAATYGAGKFTISPR